MKHGSLIKVIKKIYVGNTTDFIRFLPLCSRHWIHEYEMYLRSVIDACRN